MRRAPSIGIGEAMSPSSDADQGQGWLERILVACEESWAAGLSPPDLASLFGDTPSQPGGARPPWRRPGDAHVTQDAVVDAAGRR